MADAEIPNRKPKAKKKGPHGGGRRTKQAPGRPRIENQRARKEVRVMFYISEMEAEQLRESLANPELQINRYARERTLQHRGVHAGLKRRISGIGFPLKESAQKLREMADLFRPEQQQSSFVVHLRAEIDHLEAIERELASISQAIGKRKGHRNIPEPEENTP
ncbi:MAG: hypothetical protein M3418_05955 [Gemmatimonadota bacterium]|nr:hypothetical protein [Gemmatimonadota bacterium]